MWAYFLESVMYQERYGGSAPSFGTSWWFSPQIFHYLFERGFTRSEIFAALTPEVHSKSSLHESLVKLYPDRKTTIDQVFSRYN